MCLLRIPAYLKVMQWFTAAVFVAAMASPAIVDGATIARVEEDWELVIATPSPAAEAPQITCGISPIGNFDGLHTTFNLNYNKLPALVGGGLQLLVWEGETPIGNKPLPNQALLATPNETIKWTQVMRLEPGNNVVFEIINGTSTTWGNFGDAGTLKMTVVHPGVTLEGYSPAVSVANSGVSFAANRVTSLVLKRVRIYTSTGEMTEDTTPRVVHLLEQ